MQGARADASPDGVGPAIEPLEGGAVPDATETRGKTGSHEDEYPLHRRWKWWVHRPCFDGGSYGDTRREIVPDDPMGTIESFWRYFNNMEKPSALFGRHRARVRDGAASTLEGISLFEDGVLPDWEHVRNAMGATVVFKGSFAPQHADAVWTNALLGLVGEYAAGADSVHITGVRLIDRLSSMRVEVWLDDDDPGLSERVGRWFVEHVFGGGAVPERAVREPFVTTHAQAKAAKGEGYKVNPPPPLRRGGRPPPFGLLPSPSPYPAMPGPNGTGARAHPAWSPSRRHRRGSSARGESERGF
jgi:hypothetical protein